MIPIADSFLIQCKVNYFKKITPSNLNSFKSDDYQKLVKIAMEYFKTGRINEFSLFYQESQYLVELWAAHLIIEYGNPSIELKNEAINIIKKYSENPLNPDIAKEEMDWLDKNM